MGQEEGGLLPDFSEQVVEVVRRRRAGQRRDALRVGDVGQQPVVRVADARQQRHAQQVQLVRQAMVDDRQDARITEDYLVDAARRRIAAVGSLDVAVEEKTNSGQGGSELLHEREASLSIVTGPVNGS